MCVNNEHTFSIQSEWPPSLRTMIENSLMLCVFDCDVVVEERIWKRGYVLARPISESCRTSN